MRASIRMTGKVLLQYAAQRLVPRLRRHHGWLPEGSCLMRSRKNEARAAIWRRQRTLFRILRALHNPPISELRSAASVKESKIGRASCREKVESEGGGGDLI